MSAQPAYDRLLVLWQEIRDLTSTEELLEWEQETMMPSGGVEGRARMLGTLAALKHAKLTAAELRACLRIAAEEVPEASVEAAQVAEAARQSDRACRVPASLATALAEARTFGLAVWQEARARAEFARFESHLARLVELKKQEAAALRPDGKPYDALLDLFEPGATEAELVPLFALLRRELSPLVRQVVESGREVDESAVRGSFPAAAQRELVLQAASAIGFAFDRGRLDPSTHPFCSGVHPGDVRLTWRWQEDDLRPGLSGVLHEAGHGLYEQGLPAAWFRSPLGDAVSLGIHESQSRLWENQVGRSRAFCRWLVPRLHELFPASAGVTAERLWPALHVIRPSLIRVEADEATYNLHVLVRFELERALFADELRVEELPRRWDDLYEELLGLRPANAAEGVLQDIHWAMGSFGYFPTYTLGTLAAAQLYAAAEEQLGDLGPGFAAGEFAPLLGWLREHVHQHGSLHPPAELIRRATGRDLSPEPFLNYLRGLTREIYGVA